MMNTIDLRTIAVDLNACPSANGHPTSSPIQLESTDYSQLLRKLAGINTLSFACSLLCLVFDLIFTLIVLGMGATNQSTCPIESRIPIYLIVLGSVNLISLCFSLIACVIHHCGQDGNMMGFYCVHSSAVIIILFQLFNFIWMIIGSVWIFQIFNDVQYTYPSQTTTFCQGNVYQFAVVSLIFQYVLPLVLCCCKNIPFRF